jgi:hypothetical protein
MSTKIIIKMQLVVKYKAIDFLYFVLICCKIIVFGFELNSGNEYLKIIRNLFKSGYGNKNS